MRFTIRYQGSRLPRPISELFERAGYSISAPRPVGERSRHYTVELKAAPSERRVGTTREIAGRPALAMSLRGLRERVGRTQGEIARKVSMTQPQLSRVEARRDHLTSTLRKYVSALGGRVEIVAVVDGSRIVLEGV